MSSPPLLLLLLALVAALASSSSGVVQAQSQPQQCSFNRQPSKLIKCTSMLESALAYDSRMYKVESPGSFSLECRQQCIYRNNVLGFPCAAFIFRDGSDSERDKRNTCTFFPCVSDVMDAPRSTAVSISMSANCFATAQPTVEPTSARPTLEPTSAQPTAAPTSSHPTAAPTMPAPSTAPTTSFPSREPTRFPTLQPTTLRPSTRRPTNKATASPDPNVYQSPSGVQDWAPFDISLFQLPAFEPDAATCMVVRRAIGSSVIDYTNFIGTRNDCLKECQYMPNCNGILYSRPLQTCTLANTLETTDIAGASDEYVLNKWQAVLRRGVSMRHYNSYCALWMAEGTCNKDDGKGQCKWNTGVRGYNQVRFTDIGYCGRVKCVK